LPLIIGVVAVAVAASFTAPGAAALAAAHRFLEFYSGVLSLVALSITVMIGLAATDRVVLMIHHRILLQNVHRATAATAMLFLAVHVAMKVMEGHARLLDTVVPFMASHRPVYIGLGTVASYLMILTAWTGISRGRFAGSAHPGMWRGLHFIAYASWLFALVHGLGAGRSAKTWVLVSYGACLVGVGLALMVRLAVRWGRRSRVAKARTTGTIRPVATPVGPKPPVATSITLTNVDSSTLAGPRHTDNGRDAVDLADHQPEADVRLLGAEYIEDIPVILGSPADEPRWEQRRQSAGGGYWQRNPDDRVDQWSDLVDRGPLLEPRRSGEEISDEEFWAHMRGEAVR
jgi:hypothetical protein